MTRRPIRNQAELAAHLEWLRNAARDGSLNTRLILDGILDALAMIADALPGKT